MGEPSLPRIIDVRSCDPSFNSAGSTYLEIKCGPRGRGIQVLKNSNHIVVKSGQSSPFQYPRPYHIAFPHQSQQAQTNYNYLPNTSYVPNPYNMSKRPLQSVPGDFTQNFHPRAMQQLHTQFQQPMLNQHQRDLQAPSETGSRWTMRHEQSFRDIYLTLRNEWLKRIPNLGK